MPTRRRFRKPRKSAWLALRLLPTQKESVRMASAARGMDMSQYVLWLHERAIGTEAPHA
jgi:uncharacterized protein (DUF1778 family)